MNLQFYPTPANVVECIRFRADLKPFQRVLEPSAGTGRLVNMAVAAGCKVTAIELDWSRAIRLRWHTWRVAEVWRANFLDVHFPPEKRFERVLMNPPFNPNLDVRHVLHAWDSALAEDGLLLAVVTRRFLRAKDGQSARLRHIVEQRGEYHPLPDNRAKGATRRTVLLKLKAPSY